MKKLSDKTQKVIDIIQWICIIFLLFICITGSIFKKTDKFINNVEYQKEQSYVKIYESQNIENLKKENQQLYDSIKKLKDVESAVEIRYVYKYNTDTIKVQEFIHNDVDSVYHYMADNDTVAYEMDIKATDLRWVKGNFTINDKFTIINRENDNLNQTMIEHSPNVSIENVDTWHRVENKKKWYNNFHFGVQAGFGYGIFNKTADLYVGFGVTYVIK